VSRFFRGDDFEAARARAQEFDPVKEGEKYRLSPAVSLAIWNHALRESTDARGELDEPRARNSFHDLAARIVARGGRLVPEVGKLTRVGVELVGDVSHEVEHGGLAPRVPGRTTLVIAEAARRQEDRVTAAEPTASAPRGIADNKGDPLAADEAAQQARGVPVPQVPRPELPGSSEVARALAALRGEDPRLAGVPAARRADEPRQLDAAIGQRLGGLLGFDFARTRIVPESPEATGSTKAVTRDGAVHFRAGEYQPGTSGGDWLIAHELVHVVQQRGGRAERAGTRQELEREADQAATLAVAGHPAPIALRAESGAAYAFNEGEDHERRDQRPENTTGAHSKEVRGSVTGHAHIDDTPAPHTKADEANATDALTREAGRKDSRAHDIDARNATANHAKLTDSSQVHQERDREAVGGARGATGAAGAGPGATAEPSTGGLGSSAAHGAESRGALDTSHPGAMLASLGKAKPSEAAAALTQVQVASPAAFEAAREEARSTIPSIAAPTGLPPKTERPVRSAPGSAEGTPDDPHKQKSGGPSKKVPDKLVREAPSAPVSAPTQLPGADTHETENAGAHDDALAKGAQQALSSVRVPLAQISTQATDVPSVDLSGEADPAQISDTHLAAGEQTRTASRDAAKQVHQDYGERDVLPAATAEILTATLPAGSTEIPTIEASPRSGEIPPEALASIDGEASSALQAKISPEQQKYAQGKARHDTAMTAAHEKHRTDVTAAEEDARTQQQRARAKVQDEVGGARADWQLEIDKVGTEFRAKADSARQEHDGKLKGEQQSANSQAAEHIRSAERDADAEKRRAEDEAAAKKAEANKESKGFWGWVKSKAKSLIDGIKAAVNFIYDKLRSAVKAIFDAAKRLALGVIELARKAIVGLIKAFGAVLKGFVKIALAAFPQLRDRLLRRIDQAVHKAEQAVNAVAGALKKAVAALIDFLASTIDKILSLVQDLYNAALTVIGMLVSGELHELLRKVGQLVSSAKTAPGQFETAAYEELLGGNLDEPLSPAELIAAGRTPTGGAASNAHTESVGPGDAHTSEDSADAPKPPWTEQNVGVDQVSHGEELSPELEQEVLAHPGGEIEFGESADQSRSLDAMLGAGKDAGDGAQASAAHDAVYTDGLTPRQRAEVKWGLMKKGLSDWWSKNWPYVLAGGVLAVAGFIVANILTGGAILAALPAIMTAVGYLFTGVTVVQLAGHLRDYLTKAWAGDIQGGGKSLAKGLAAAVIELLTWLTFKVGGAALKAGKAAAKGVVKGAQAVGRGVAAAGKGIARVAKAGLGYVVRAGKVLLGGVGRGIGRVAKRIKDLGAKLLARTKFKGFRIRLQGRHFFLEGKINPWVLLADGTLKWEKTKGHGGLGSKTKIDGQDAIVLGNTKADEVAALLKNNPEAKADALALLSRSDVDAGAILKGLEGLGPDEAAGLIKKLRDFKEVDEAVLRQAIADYRKTTGIAKTADAGGVVASGKAEFGHAGVDDAKYTAGSTHAQVEPVHNPRYGHPNRGENWAKLLDNHAEQNVLGDIANKIDDVYAGKIPRTDVTGTVKMAVDQKVCNACRAGLSDGQAGILKQFSNEFPNVTVMISATDTAEILVIKAGKVLIKGG
jgi:hypothetical protein